MHGALPRVRAIVGPMPCVREPLAHRDGPPPDSPVTSRPRTYGVPSSASSLFLTISAEGEATDHRLGVVEPGARGCCPARPGDVGAAGGWVLSSGEARPGRWCSGGAAHAGTSPGHAGWAPLSRPHAQSPSQLRGGNGDGPGSRATALRPRWDSAGPSRPSPPGPGPGAEREAAGGTCMTRTELVLGMRCVCRGGKGT